MFSFEIKVKIVQPGSGSSPPDWLIADPVGGLNMWLVASRLSLSGSRHGRLLLDADLDLSFSCHFLGPNKEISQIKLIELPTC
jgi:hypothetical protein